MAHFLRQLELNGFKSFAQKTTLEFPAGITAIVGPNGSGKSNIVDAIRWLLGEREARSLRGGKVEDLIFAGTPKRPRTGLAQASLHFDNTKKFFPVEFSEVVVTREVRRDGVSRYFLNKAEILLRDLVDFFAKVRLGSRGLVVVTQGNSDVFIEASPTARREMIEEILGLREYQIKKLDAERRLKNSQVNLEKVKALIEEILPHLRSLKRQTGRWEKREELAEELRTLEDQFFGSAWQEFHEKIKNVEKEIEEHQKKFERLKEEKEKAEARVKEVEASQPKEREELRKIKAQTHELLGARSRLEKEIGRLEAQIELQGRTSASPDSPSVQKLIELARSVRDGLRKALSDEGDELKRSIQSVLHQIDAVLEEGAGKEKTSAGGELQSLFEKIKRDLERVERDVLDLGEKEKSLEKNQEQFYLSFKKAVGELEEAKDKVEAWEKDRREKLFAKEGLELRLHELEHQIVQAGRKPEEFKDVKLDPQIGGGDTTAHERRIFKLRGDLASIGEIDEALMKEAKETETRYEFLKHQSDDLLKACEDLGELIVELNEKVKTEFSGALVKINEEFDKFFGLMFPGGHAKLKLVFPKKPVLDEENEEDEETSEGGEEEEPKEEESEGGIEMDLRLPRKRINSLEVLSGGERSLVGIAAIFALVSVSPPPFLVLDEIDAPLDDRNARRFAEMLKEFSKKTQFIVVTHNRATMEAANVLYGVTVNDDGTSKILSMKLEQ
ncbi:hypothetical protein C4571_02420 [Candidatus Parcubacteria bacterium]|nr:MAG: hypothetical protein C4571_02420 [Candidatus Parcubacteria bacterium]